MKTATGPLLRIERLLSESLAFEQGGNMTNALASALKAVEESTSSNSVEVKLKTQARYSALLVQVGRFLEAGHWADRILGESSETPMTVDGLIVKGMSAALTDDLSGAEKYLFQAANLSRQLGYHSGLALALHNLSTSVYVIRGQFQLALTAMEEAAEIKKGEGVTHWGLPFLKAYIYQVLGDRKRAMKGIDELMPLISPATRIAGVYYLLWARLSLDEYNLEKGEEYLRLALRIANQTGVPDLNIWVRLEYSRYNRLKRNFPEARTWAEDGYRYAQRSNIRYFSGLSMVERGQAYWQLENLEMAEKDLRDALDIFESLSAAYDTARAALLLAELKRLLNRADAADTWSFSAQLILEGGYAFILERERTLAFPLIAIHLHDRQPRLRKVAEDLIEQLANVPPPPLRVAGLGRFIVWQGNLRIPDQAWQRRKAGEMFRFLLLQPDFTTSREAIISALWPEQAPGLSADVFHQATSALRHILEPDLPEKFPSRYLTVENERVFLRLPTSSQVDFIQFENGLPPAITDQNLEVLQRTLAIYTDELFPMDRYSDWSAMRRDSLAELYLQGQLALAECYFSHEKYFDTLSCVRTILKKDNWNERAVLLGMKTYIKLLDVPHALNLYLELEKTLREDLSIAPRPDLQKLAEELRNRR